MPSIVAASVRGWLLILVLSLTPPVVATGPVENLSCTTETGTSTATLSWSNPRPFTGINIYVNGTLDSVLPGDATEHMSTGTIGETVTYCVEALDGGSPTDVACCVLVLGSGVPSDLIWDSTPSGNSGGSATAISAAVNDHGGLPAIVPSLDGLDLSLFQTVWAIAGTYPDNIVISESEGQQLADYCLGGGPLGFQANLYIEGTDTFAFDDPVAVHDLDHTAGDADGESIVSITGLETIDLGGTPVGFDLSGLGTVPYTDPSNQFIDHIIADTAVGSGLSHVSETGQGLGIYGDAQLSGLGNQVHRTATSSAAGGGFGDNPQLYFQALVEQFDPTIVEPMMYRGDCDGDLIFNGLTDGIYALTFQFIPGTEPPPCLAQCDADADEIFNGLTDGIIILNFQFIPGSTPIPEPFGSCGLEPGSVNSLGLVGCTAPPCP